MCLPVFLHAEETIRERVLRLLTEVHSSEKETREAAVAELYELGIREDRLRYAGLLKHPDRAARLRLVSQLSEVPDPLRTDLRTELMVDPDSHIREAVVGTLKKEHIKGRTGERLKNLQRTERNPLVRRQIERLLNPEAVAKRKPRPPETKRQQIPLQLKPASSLPAQPFSISATRPQATGPKQQVLQESFAPGEKESSSAPEQEADDFSDFADPVPYIAKPGPQSEVEKLKPASTSVTPAGPSSSGIKPSGIKPTAGEVGPEPPVIEVLTLDSFGIPPAPAGAVTTLPEPLGPPLSNDELFQTQTLESLQPFRTRQREGGRNPEILDRPLENELSRETQPGVIEQVGGWVTPEPQPPYGFSGPSGILPNEVQESAHFVPQIDRWRNGYDKWDRYGKDHPWMDDYPGVEGHWWDPYNQNVLKGDFPIVGQRTFFNLTATNLLQFDWRQSPIGTTPFESTRASNNQEFFGNNNQTFLNETLFLRMDLFHGNQTGFKPIDWMIRVTPTVNMNQFHVDELAVVNPDVRFGRTRHRDHFAFQEYFAEVKVADISPDYDFASVRAGNQFFNSDFRGFIFFDTNRAIRLFGSRLSNRHQFNLLFYDNVEKETNSGLNTTRDRHQNVLIANYYIQDFIFPGYTFQTSFHWNNDQPSTKFDRNDFLVRPDPVGIFQPHRVESYYFGIAGDGHMGRINVNNAFYWATGRDSLNPIAGQPMDINAFMGALELSYDRDWARFRASLFFSSGDDDPSDNDGEGFDSIIDNPAFAGGEFSYWQRQAIQLFGVRLVNDRSLVPDLRSSGIQGQSNFTNPGLFLFNLGLDMDLTPKLRMILNANYLMFDETEVLSAYTFQGDVDNEIGVDLSCGFEWRPFHNDNAIMLFGVSALIPDEGFKDLYNEFNAGDTETLFASFFEMILTY